MDVIKVTGTIVEIFNEVKVSDKFLKRELVVKTQDQYPEEILIQFVQDKCGLLDNFGEGQLVEVCVNLKGRSWNSPSGEVRYFNTIQGWRIDEFKDIPQQKAPSESTTGSSGVVVQEMIEEQDEDLPF